MALSGTAVAPPLGPVATVEKPDSPSVGIGVLRSLVRGFAQQSVDRVNATLAAQHKPGHVSIGDVSAWSPYRLATELQNQPNQYFVKAPFGVTINVELPVVADRTI